MAEEKDQPVEESVIEETPEHPENPDSPEIPPEQPVEDSSKFDFISELVPKKDEKKETEETTKVETKVETKTDEVKEGFTYGDKKLKWKTKDKEVELIEHDFGEGVIGFIPADKKDGYLMQSDYTKKTQEVATRSKELTDKETLLSSKEQELKTLEYVDLLSRPPLKPVLDTLGDLKKPDGTDYQNGEVMLGKDGKPNGKVVFTNQASYIDADDMFSKYDKDYQILENKKENTKAETLKNFTEFEKEFGKETFDKVQNELLKYYNPYVFKQLAPVPKEVLSLVRKGLMYDDDLAKKDSEVQKKIDEAVLLKVKELEKGGTKTVKTPETTATETGKDVHDRYKWIS